MDGLSPMNILNKLTSPLAVRAAIAECDRLSRDRFLAYYHFKPAKDYVLRYEGREYDSKAIAAVAFGYEHGVQALSYRECEGGKAYGRAGWALFRLGFRVSGMREDREWRIDEVEPAIDAYLELMELKSTGEAINARSALQLLHKHNPRRSVWAFNLKFKNISAALDEINHPFLTEFSPEQGGHYQKLILWILKDRFGRGTEDVETVFQLLGDSKIDWGLRDAQNRELGVAGERFVFEREKERLINSGEIELSKKVKWVAELSDTYGYDIESFDEQGQEIQIEVKTTAHGRSTQFFVSPNELAVSKARSKTYQLHRVFNFFGARDVDVRSGAFESHCELSPSAYRASIR
jgi:hypothetical protein